MWAGAVAFTELIIAGAQHPEIGEEEIVEVIKKAIAQNVIKAVVQAVI